jgi:Icc-related predicted phosphoesterase
MRHILQFSDLHLGSDYDGHLDTVGQWEAVLKHAKKTCPDKFGYDAVIITGDLIDDAVCVDPDNNSKSHDEELSEAGKLKQYVDIIEAAKALTVHGKVMVTPGNHDNRQLLGKAAVKAGLEGAREDMFMVPGSCIQMMLVGGHKLITMDSGTVEPYRAIAELAYWANTANCWDRKNALLFTHKPFKTPNLYHRFMKDNMLDSDIYHHMCQYVGHYFCGHLHHLYSLDGEYFGMYGCPGIQCQIDPYSKKCNAVPFPGYLSISFKDMETGVNSIQFHMLDNWKEILCED